MGKKGAGTARQKDRAGYDDRKRLRRFVFLWAPVILIVLIVLYAAALDPSKPTGRTMEASIIGKDVVSGGHPASSTYKVKVDNGDEAVVFIPEKQAPPSYARIVLQEYSTTLFKKKTYKYLKTK
ncbi:MAG: hypothetical protein PHC90_08580 [Syntrophorhabdaceae bacterium]|nr:hypothetical protein [Syntrophorhabdaceae bacterium]